ncbi:uncharacterized protein [Spinacia oleracea]|uniref:Uncharacterized protein isoform X3 n=1 Tax=Spinacia oleracea TaxID=3562 RepID=A0A9R0J1T2_SPIOL|nr:uncharacterized protein LOC110797641 isoform X3 [Spinacia oleracea]
MCFSSETGKWVTKSANYMLYMHQYGCDGAFEFDGKLYWADMQCGLIVWDDPFGDLDKKEKVECRFIPSPVHFKDVLVGGGFIQCVQISGEGEGYRGFLSLWRLKDNGGEGEWSLAHKVSFSDIWSDESYLAYGLSEVIPRYCFIHPWEADIVFFHIQGRIFSLNVRTKKVESCGDGYSSIIESVFVIPYVLPSWPTSLPPCLTAGNAKEQGNKYFKAKKFNEAITCYTRSIALLRNAVAYANRTMAYIMVSRFHEAEDDCTQALNLDPLYFKGYCRRAIAKKELGNLEGSMEDVVSSLELKPDNKQMKQKYVELKSLLEKAYGIY